MHTGLELSFVPGSLENPQIVLILQKYLRFVPYGMSKGLKGYPWHPKKFASLTRKYNGDECLSVYGLNYNLIAFALTTNGAPHQSVTINLDRNIYFPTGSDIEELISIVPGFTSAHFF